MAAEIRLYLDENLPPIIVEQLSQRGIDAVCVRDPGLLGDTDANHLIRATQMQRVLATSDADFLRMSAEEIEHAGMIYGKQSTHSIGDWVKGLELVCSVYTAEDMQNVVEYL